MCDLVTSMRNIRRLLEDMPEPDMDFYADLNSAVMAYMDRGVWDCDVLVATLLAHAYHAWEVNGDPELCQPIPS